MTSQNGEELSVACLTYLTVHLIYTDSDYPFGIFKLFLYIYIVLSDWYLNMTGKETWL